MPQTGLVAQGHDRSVDLSREVGGMTLSDRTSGAVVKIGGREEDADAEE